MADDDAHRIDVLGPDGVTHSFEGIALFAGDAFRGESLIVAHGSSSDAAWAFCGGYDKPALGAFYKSAALHFMAAIDPKSLGNERDAEEVLARWDKEDGKEPVGNA